MLTANEIKSTIRRAKIHALSMKTFTPQQWLNHV